MPVDYDSNHISCEKTFLAGTPATLVCPAGTKSFFVIMGSSTKLVKVTQIHVSGLTMTARAYNNVVARKISSIPSGGTASELEKTPADKINVSTVSLCQVYTTAPTTDGTLVGTLQINRILINDSNPVQGDPQSEILLNFKETFEESGIILRGVDDGISVAFGSAPATAVTLSLEVEWTEINN